MANLNKEKGDNIQSGQGDSDQPQSENLPSNNDIIDNEDDLKLRRRRSNNDTLISHNALFTNLLRSYVESARSILTAKPQQKKIVFAISLVMLLWFSLLIGIVVIISLVLVALDVNITKLLSVILPSIVSFVTVIIEIPKIISKYLLMRKKRKQSPRLLKQYRNMM